MTKLVLGVATSLFAIVVFSYILGSIYPYVMERSAENQDVRNPLLGACKSMAAIIGLL